MPKNVAYQGRIWLEFKVIDWIVAGLHSVSSILIAIAMEPRYRKRDGVITNQRRSYTIQHLYIWDT